MIDDEPSNADGNYPGVGPFNFSWLPWFLRPAVKHDRDFDDVIKDGADPGSLWAADSTFYDVLDKEIENPSVTKNWQRPYARLTDFLSKPLVYSWTLMRYFQGKFGEFRQDARRGDR